MTTRDGRTFDWSPRFDPRSLNFRAAAGVTQLPDRGRLWAHGPVLDQGAEGACTGMAATGAVLAAPSSRKVPNPNRYAQTWYRRAQRLDEWPGEAYDGSSVLATCLVGRERKLWTGFRWSKRPEELAAGIVSDDLGPAIVGVQWSDQLYEPPRTGLLPADVRLDPDLGHAVLLFGYLPAWEQGAAWEQEMIQLGLLEAWRAAREPVFPVLNSWSETWGAGGRAVAPLSLVRRWHAARGEFALPENRTKGAPRMGGTQPEEEQEERPGDRTLHLRADEVEDGDRILDPPDELEQESVTVRGAPRMVSGWNGQRVLISSTAGVFQLGAADPVAVRRAP